MSYRRDRQIQFGVWGLALQKMNIEKWELAADFVVSMTLLSTIFLVSANPAAMGALAAFVHSVHLPRMLRAYREAEDEYGETNETR